MINQDQKKKTFQRTKWEKNRTFISSKEDHRRINWEYIMWLWVIGAVIVSLLIAQTSIRKYHPINDIHVPMGKPLSFPVSDHRNPYRDHFLEHQESCYPWLKERTITLHKGDEVVDLFNVVLAVARSQTGWKIVHVDESQQVLQARVTTRIMRFVDDVSVSLLPVKDSPRKFTIAMRSKSRLGRSDLGANAKRIHSFCQKVVTLYQSQKTL